MNIQTQFECAIIVGNLHRVVQLVYQHGVKVTHNHIYLAKTMQKLCGYDDDIIQFLKSEYIPPIRYNCLTRLVGIDIDFSSLLF